MGANNSLGGASSFRGTLWVMFFFMSLNLIAAAAAAYLSQDFDIRLLSLCAAGVVLAVLLFIFGGLVLRKVGRLEEAAHTQAEKTNDFSRVFDSIEDGVFVLDSAFSFGPVFSKSLSTMLNRPILAGGDFQTLYGDLAGADELELAVMYLRLMFSGRIKDKLLRDANPMREVPVKTSNGDIRYLKFSFCRFGGNKQPPALLGAVTDVTTQVTLRKELETTKRQADQQWDVMLRLVQMQPDTLMKFINEATIGVMEIHDRLKSVGGSISDYRTMLSHMFRQAHAIKGNATTIGLAFVASEAHALENLMDKIRGQDTYGADELLELEEALLALSDHLGWLRKAATRCTAPNSGNRAAEPVASHIEYRNNLADLSKRIADARNKEVQTEVNFESLAKLPEEKANAIRTITTQLVRNAIVHGIEQPRVRLDAGKNVKGVVQIELAPPSENKPFYVLRVYDDGCGLSATHIRQVMLEKGYKTEAEVAALSDQQVVMEIFRSGFSTAETLDEHAGRGVGLDVVHQVARSIGGQVRLKTELGVFTEFRVEFAA